MYGRLEHAAKDGCTPAGQVLPFFLFRVGVQPGQAACFSGA